MFIYWTYKLWRTFSLRLKWCRLIFPILKVVFSLKFICFYLLSAHLEKLLMVLCYFIYITDKQRIVWLTITFVLGFTRKKYFNLPKPGTGKSIYWKVDVIVSCAYSLRFALKDMCYFDKYNVTYKSSLIVSASLVRLWRFTFVFTHDFLKKRKIVRFLKSLIMKNY